MAAKQPVLTPRYCIQHSRFTKQDGWRLKDLSLSLNGNIAVTGYNKNTLRTYIAVYTNVRHSDSRDKPKIIYSKEFEKYSDGKWIYVERRISFIDDDVLVSCLGYKLEVFQINNDEVLRSRRVNGWAMCLSVRERREIFIGFWISNKITVYDVIDLNEIKSIILQGIQDGYWPKDVTAIADRIFVCVGEAKEGSNDKPLIFEEKNGRILSELTKPTDTVQWYVMGFALNITLNVIAVAWTQTLEGTRKGKDVIVFYSLLSENNCSFLIVEVEFVVSRIRISDRGDRIVWKDRVTRECKVYDMAEFLTYHQLRQNLASQLQVDDCVSLINYFALPKDQSEAILNSGTVTENLLSVLEETSVLQPSYVDRLIEAFKDLNINSSCYHLVDFYRRTRMPATSYDKFLATLSAHLVASLPSNLCDYFNITDESKTSILSSQNPGLSLLLSLDKIGVIKESDVAALEPPFTGMELVQAVAMIHEYQSIVEEEKIPFLEGIESADERKREFFVLCLQRKIKSWYETMTPVPWRKSCKWSVSDLFVGSGLILTDSKSKRSLSDVDEKCKVESKEIFSHDRLKDETRIILEGDPGCGKTMLMSQLAYDWSQGQLIDIKLLILLPLKFVQQRTLAEAIKEFYVPEDKGLSITDIEKFLDDKQNPAHLLLDGLEEYSGKQKQEKSEVRKVITRKKYPFCKVLISSRSDFAKDLPKTPMLKLGMFGEIQRSSYIEKLFPNDSNKQMGTKQIIGDSPIIQDLCSVPLLFALAVHNVGNMGKAQIGQLDRVTPFVRGMVDTLCPVESLITKTQELVLEDQVQKETSLEELAFNGLCRGSQQLFWQKDYFDEKIHNSKEWIDSGVLVIEESSYSMPIDKKDQHAKSAATEASATSVSSEDKSQPSGMGEVAEEQSGVDIHSQMRAEEDSDKDSEETTSSDEDDTTSSEEGSDKDSEETASFDEDDTTSSEEEEINSDYDEEEGVTTEAGGSIAKHVPLQVRFLHKIIQEWFAAKYFSSMISRVNLHLLKKYLYENLPLINPADLHHVLRFTCGLYPPSCHIIIKHLLSYRTEEGDVPEYIMNCIFLCLAEYTGDYNPSMLEVLSEICMENIMIHCDDSRLLQHSKVMLLEVASSRQIPIKKVQLLDVVRVAEETGLTLNSDVTLDVLDTLQVIEVSRWDQTLTEKDYSNLVAYIATSKSIHTANLSFPSQPPVLQPRTLEQVASRNLTVHWQIGRLEQTLGASKGIWTMHFGAHRGHVQETFPLSVDPDLKSQVLSREMSTLSLLPGTSGTPFPVPSKLESSKRPTTEVASSKHEVSIAENRTKYSEGSSPSERKHDERKVFDQHTTFREAEVIITRKGGIIEIPNTGVELYIPANAFEDDMEECLIQIRIISPFTLDESDGAFISNSSTTVEILPNKLKLKKSVILTMPHCLELESGFEDMKNTAQIFMSHHENGNPPIWEEKPYLHYSLENRKCSIWLQSFCWVKYLINGEYVKGKKIRVFTASKELSLGDDIVEIEVGYYPDLPGGGEILHYNPNLIVSQSKPFIFLKKGKMPLTLTLQKVVPGSWTPEQNPQEIPFQCIANSEERSCPFVFVNENKGQSFPVFIFWISQGDRGFRQTIRPALKGLDT